VIVQKNPLTVVGTITRCLLFTYRTPAADATRLLPRPLEAVTRDGYAFWNIVVSRLRAMRPPGFPALVGVDYWHVAYRLYVRLPLPGGRAIEGLYFTRSDCDNRLMTLAGNLLTGFNFHTTPIRLDARDGGLDLDIASPDAPARARVLPRRTPELAPGSPFASLDEAAVFLKYKPFGIAIDKKGDANVVRITRREDAWRARLIQVEFAHWTYFDDKAVQPEICYEVAPIVYRWNRGEVLRTVVSRES